METKEAVVSNAVKQRQAGQFLEEALEAEENFKARVDGQVQGVELNSLPYLLALPVMYLLTAWAAFKTVLCILLALPFWAIRWREWKQVRRAVIVRWFQGPFSCASLLFDGLSCSLARIRAGAQGYSALDIIYNWRIEEIRWNCVGVWLARWWIGMRNAQAVRNRLRLSKRFLTESILELVGRGEREIRILSIASGSAKALIEALAALRAEMEEQEVLVRIRLVDREKEALTHAARLAAGAGIADWVSVYQKEVKEMEAVCDNGQWRPQIVEMIGFLDYRSTLKAIQLEERIYRLLAPGGIHLTGHIMPNSEAIVLRWLIRWPMRYRRPAQLGQILAVSFGASRVELILEPHRIHCLALARKPEIGVKK